MKLLHGHIYLVEFDPSSGHEFQKMRPAVVISSDEMIKKSSLISCVPFTSNIKSLLNSEEIFVKKSELNRLFCDSVLKTSHISTFDKCRVVKYIGKLEEEVFDCLKRTIARNFNLAELNC
jgi:mRNA interferase MazF